MKITNETVRLTPTHETTTLASPVPTNVRTVPRYRQREVGVGYGTSSGYASTRRYASDRGDVPLRCR